LAAAGQGIAAIGAAIGSAGFWSYRSHRGLPAASLRRSRNLSISSALFAVGFGSAAAGVIIVALATARSGADGLLVAYYWLDIPYALSIAVAGICASVCFYRSWQSAASEMV
jgi:hypothetical protein